MGVVSLSSLGTFDHLSELIRLSQATLKIPPSLCLSSSSVNGENDNFSFLLSLSLSCLDCKDFGAGRSY